MGGQRGVQIAVRHGDVAKAGSRPENLMFIGPLARQLYERTRNQPSLKSPSALSRSSAVALA
jgi:hypothetical protein